MSILSLVSIKAQNGDESGRECIKTKKERKKERKRERKKQNSRCNYNVTLRRTGGSFFPSKSKKYYTFISVCIYVGTQARGLVHARACVRVALLVQHATRMRHVVT